MSKILSRENLAKTIDLFKINKILNVARDTFVKDLRILAYHRICNLDQYNDNDAALISASEEQFDWQVKYVNKSYDLINFEDLKDIVDKKLIKPKRPVIITFDDGFSDNYKNAYPILKKHKAKATFFVSTGYIGTKKHFWFNQVFRSFKNPVNSNVIIQDLNIDIKLSPVNIEREKQIHYIIEKLKKCQNHKRVKLVDYISDKYPARNFDSNLSLPLTWEQLKEMSENDIEIGSHTINHPVLSRLTQNELFNEAHESKHILENKLNKSVSTIAYPVGMSFTYNDDVLKEVKKASYDFGVSYIAGTNYFSSLNHYDLKRIHVEHYTTKAMFKSMLSFPELFAVY